MQFVPSDTLYGMQLIQIGEAKQKTVLDLVLEMAERQNQEIEALKIRVRTSSTRQRS